MKIAFVTPETDPVVRRTPLADFARALPKALCEVGADVRLFVPATQPARTDKVEDLEEVGQVRGKERGGHETFQILGGKIDGVPIYLFDSPRLFAGRDPYSDDENGPYEDNWRRYSLFSRAVLESFETLGFAPDIIHCVDWTTGLIPVLHELEYVAKKRKHPATRAGTFFQVQNLAFQGNFEREVLPKIGLPHSIFQDIGGVEKGGRVNFLKAGCEFGTILGTFSPGHALRIQEQDRGYGLEDVFRRRHKELVGITNGIDYHAWDPANDPLLAQSFSSKDKDLAGKRKCKAALQAALSLDKGPRTPIVAMIGRFDSDSGFDLLAEMLTPILERNIEVVLMGSGRRDIEERLKTMESTFVGRCRVVNGFQSNTAHAIMGGADLLLLPSHYSPGNALCAIGMRYGVVPVIFGGSGLEDYVVDLGENPRGGTGFHFHRYTGDGLLEGIDHARKLYRNATAWKAVVQRCLRQDFSWIATANEYLKAYRRVTRRVRPRSKSA